MVAFSIFCNLILLKFKFFTRNIGKIKTLVNFSKHELNIMNLRPMYDMNQRFRLG